MHAFVVLDFVFPYQAKRLAWGTSPKGPILCQVGRKSASQSIRSRGWRGPGRTDVARHSTITFYAVVLQGWWSADRLWKMLVTFKRAIKFRMQVWNVLRAARWNTGCKKSPSRHHRATLSSYIFGTEACIDNPKKNLLNGNISYMSC